MDRITEYCTGCRTCEQVCPVKCIKMDFDGEGFLSPFIDQSKCINCGLCERRCPQNHIPLLHTKDLVYGLKDKNLDSLKNSASGGAFAVIAREILNEGGVVYGASYTLDLKVKHIKIESINDLERVQGSKYVQSDVEYTFIKVKEDLINGISVLYSGTPCQIAGLKSYLNKDFSNLYTVDLICHGVPSPILFNTYLRWYNDKLGEQILQYDFRDKSSGWGLGYKAKAKTKAKTKTALSDPYYYHFLKGDTYRECCYRCNFCRKERVADITIGDFWGVENEYPKFYSVLGVSVILINTFKGKDIFNKIHQTCDILETEFKKVARYNSNLLHPSQRPALRDSIYNNIYESNYQEYINKHLISTIPLLRRIINFVPISLKKFLMRFLHP